MVNVFKLGKRVIDLHSSTLTLITRNYCGTPTENIHILMLLLESALFGLFTMCMKGDQMTIIASNQTQIDRLKNMTYESNIDINEIFGCPGDVR
jgi:hypothetical protein